MKLPNAATRSSLRLANPAQRLCWAMDQLLSGARKSAPIAVVTSRNEVAIPARKGFIAPYSEFAASSTFVQSDNNFRYDYLWLPVNTAKYAAGYPIERCVIEISTDPVIPYLTVPAGNPIDDNSLSTTIEEYIAEQVKLLKIAAPNDNIFDYEERASWYLNDYLSNTYSVLKLRGISLIDYNYQGNDRYGKYVVFNNVPQ